MKTWEMKLATEAALWVRLEALEFADNARDWDEISRLQDEIVSRERPWHRLEASFEAALEDETQGA
jgi:hypothetical protein